MRAGLISIQPYWVFLIIARLMGWDIPQEKTVEVRKDFPRDSAWNKKTLIYCSKSMRSFKRIPVQYQPFMKQLLGKVIGEFVCNQIDEIKPFGLEDPVAFEKQSCMRGNEIMRYLGGLYGFGWHISDLKIYDKPKELREFRTPCPSKFASEYACSVGYRGCPYFTEEDNGIFGCSKEGLKRPPQSWCYVEEI